MLSVYGETGFANPIFANAPNEEQLPLMKDAMRALIASASTSLQGLPANEHVAMEAILWTYSWENSRNMPKRVFMAGEKQKLVDAQLSRADVAQFIEEQER